MEDSEGMKSGAPSPQGEPLHKPSAFRKVCVNLPTSKPEARKQMKSRKQWINA